MKILNRALTKAIAVLLVAGNIMYPVDGFTAGRRVDPSGRVNVRTQMLSPVLFGNEAVVPRPALKTTDGKHFVAPISVPADAEVKTENALGRTGLFVLNLWPEITALAISVIAGGGAFLVPAFGLAVAVLRLGWFLATLGHELAHAFSIIIRDGETFSFKKLFSMVRMPSVLVFMFSWLTVLFPSLRPEHLPSVIYEGELGQDKLVFASGIIFNTFGVVLGAVMAVLSPAGGLLAFAGAVIGIVSLMTAVSSSSDIRALLDPNSRQKALNCGVIFLRSSGENAFNRNRSIVKESVAFAITRGEQAGGRADVLEDGTYLLTKEVTVKRRSLPNDLDAKYERKAKAQKKKFNPKLHTTIGHVRFATSAGGPSELETHPHIWLPARKVKVWSLNERGAPVVTERRIVSTIAHNGDFDAFHFPGVGEMSYAELGTFLNRIFGSKNTTSGDSPKIAGMLDLLLTQGMVGASLRLAYLMNVAGPNGTLDYFPDNKVLEDWEKIVNDVMPSVLGTFTLAGVKTLSDMAASEEDIVRMLMSKVGHELSNTHSEFLRPVDMEKFITGFVHAFFCNDILEAMRFFIAHAEGSFGLAAHSTLVPDRSCFVSKGQPLTVGYDDRLENIGVFSAAGTVKISLEDGTNPMRYRLDLEQFGLGEIALVDSDGIHVSSVLEDKSLSPFNHIRVGAGKLEVADTLEPRVLDVHDRDNPYITPTREISGDDPVGSELMLIPDMLRDNRDSFRSDPVHPENRGLNAQTTEDFVSILKNKAINRLNNRHIGNSYMDIVIVGEENNEYIATEFLSDLNRLFPGLRMTFMHPNLILQGREAGRIGPDTVFIAASHSSQNFAVLHALNAVEKYRKARRLEFARLGIPMGDEGASFAVVGEMDSPMSEIVGQNLNKDAPFSRRVWCTQAGKTRAQPSTLASVAMVHTYSEILHSVMDSIVSDESFLDVVHSYERYDTWVKVPSATDVRRLRKNMDDMVERDASNIVGNNRLHSATHEKLVKGGRRWANFITEQPLSWACTALFILTTVAFLGTPMHILLGILGGVSPVWAVFGLNLFPVFTGLIDAVIYIFFNYGMTYLIRRLQGRPVTHRVGTRGILIGADSMRNARLMEIYTTKLAALAFPLTSWWSNAAETTVDFLGREIIRNTRGVMNYFMDMDTRQGHDEERLIDASQNMARSQMTGIQNSIFTHIGKLFERVLPRFITDRLKAIKSGPEILTVGYAEHRENNRAYVSLSDNIGHSAVPDESEMLTAFRRSRVNSVETLMSSYVFFYEMAKKISSFPLQRFDIARSQGAKEQTTASPTPGAVWGIMDKYIGRHFELTDEEREHVTALTVRPVPAKKTVPEPGRNTVTTDSSRKTTVLTAPVKVKPVVEKIASPVVVKKEPVRVDPIEGTRRMAVRLPKPKATGQSGTKSKTPAPALVEPIYEVSGLTALIELMKNEKRDTVAFKEKFARLRALCRDTDAFDMLLLDPEAEGDVFVFFVRLTLEPATPAPVRRELVRVLKNRDEMGDNTVINILSRTVFGTGKINAAVKKAALELVEGEIRVLLSEGRVALAEKIAQALLSVASDTDRMPSMVSAQLIKTLSFACSGVPGIQGDTVELLGGLIVDESRPALSAAAADCLVRLSRENEIAFGAQYLDSAIDYMETAYSRSRMFGASLRLLVSQASSLTEAEALKLVPVIERAMDDTETPLARKKQMLVLVTDILSSQATLAQETEKKLSAIMLDACSDGANPALVKFALGKCRKNIRTIRGRNETFAAAVEVERIVKKNIVKNIPAEHSDIGTDIFLSVFSDYMADFNTDGDVDGYLAGVRNSSGRFIDVVVDREKGSAELVFLTDNMDGLAQNDLYLTAA